MPAENRRTPWHYSSSSVRNGWGDGQASCGVRQFEHTSEMGAVCWSSDKEREIRLKLRARPLGDYYVAGHSKEIEAQKTASGTAPSRSWTRCIGSRN